VTFVFHQDRLIAFRVVRVVAVFDVDLHARAKLAGAFALADRPIGMGVRGMRAIPDTPTHSRTLAHPD
jgi:hypothetical protein